jgi:hypothetical protein
MSTLERGVAIVYEKAISFFKKENGTAYSSLSELIAATDGFFGNPAFDAKTALDSIAGQDFLAISDTDAHTGLDCTMIVVMEAAVISSVVVGGSNVVSAKGLSGLSLAAGTMLPFGKVHATAITLTSGKVIAYIN